MGQRPGEFYRPPEGELAGNRRGGTKKKIIDLHFDFIVFSISFADPPAGSWRGVGIGGEKEIDFASRFPPRHIATFRPEMAEIDVGSMKNGSAASDLPPEGSKKKRWVDLRNFGQKCQK